jgi:peptide/nickel transport system ATP-binding protein
MVDPVIVVEKLKLSLPRLADRAFAVDDISLSIAAGEMLCVVGESGSGKSMLAHSVMGLLPTAVKAVAGSIQIGGRDLLALDEAAMQGMRGREIGMIFQEPMTSLNPVMRVGEQIAETFEAHGLLDRTERQARAVALLTEVGLPDPARIVKTYPHELSGGQRQRVMIAMALALKPRLLIADEPTTALDVTTQAQILHLIDDLRRKHGTAVLFITHDFGVVADIADRIAVLQHGVLVEEGLADDVLGNPQHPYTKRLIAAVPSLNPPRRETKHGAEALAVRGLSKTYRRRSFFQPSRVVAAVDDVSFTLSKGETLGLVGESGSGKSTIGRCCLRLTESDQGQVVLNGVTLGALSRSELRRMRGRIQMVFQDPYASLNPRQTIGRIIADGPVAQGMAAGEALRKARDLLELVGLSENAIDRYPHEFSGGQRQRIGIARALALEPDVLVADEPVSALDVSVQEQILALIKTVQEKLGLAILFVTHDLRVAAQVCDRVIVLQQGRIVESGETAELFARPKHAYTQQLLAAIPGGARFRN